MKRIAVFAALVASIMVLPSTSSARTDCSQSDVQQTVAGITVGVEAGGTGTTGQADAAVGACVDAGSAGAPAGEPGDALGFYGGLAEVGVGTPVGGGPTGAYGVVDGDDDNSAVSTQGGGYAGVSAFETGTPDPDCDGVDEGNGSNGGGCLHIRDTPVAIPLVPIACGNTSGKSYDASQRDGCTVP